MDDTITEAPLDAVSKQPSEDALIAGPIGDLRRRARRLRWIGFGFIGAVIFEPRSIPFGNTRLSSQQILDVVKEAVKARPKSYHSA